MKYPDKYFDWVPGWCDKQNSSGWSYASVPLKNPFSCSFLPTYISSFNFYSYSTSAASLLTECLFILIFKYLIQKCKTAHFSRSRIPLTLIIHPITWLKHPQQIFERLGKRLFSTPKTSTYVLIIHVTKLLTTCSETSAC